MSYTAEPLDTVRRAAEQGDAEAQYDLGVRYAWGDGGVDLDLREAANWYRKAAEQRLAEAEHELGKMYYNGHGVNQDFPEAAKWLGRAAEQGDKQASDMVATIQKLWRLGVAAEQGEDDAQDELTHMYASGLAKPRNDREVDTWYREAAERGETRGRVGLALMYARGLGVPKDPEQVVKWLPRMSLMSKHRRLFGQEPARLVLVLWVAFFWVLLNQFSLLRSQAGELLNIVWNYPVTCASAMILGYIGAVFFGVKGQTDEDLYALGFSRQRWFEGVSGDLPAGTFLPLVRLLSIAMNWVPAAIFASMATSFALDTPLYAWPTAAAFMLFLYARWLTSAIIVYCTWSSIAGSLTHRSR